MFSPKVANPNNLFMSLANYHKHYKYPKGSTCTELLQVLLVFSGNVALNSGPRTAEYRTHELVGSAEIQWLSTALHVTFAILGTAVIVQA